MYDLANKYRIYYEAVKRDQSRCTHGSIIEDKGHSICFYCNKVFEMFIIYTKPDCPFCVKAKLLLKDHTIKEIVVGEDISSEDYKDLMPGFTTVPGIWKGSVFIGGYEDLLRLW